MDLDLGTGNIALEPKKTVLYHFVPDQPIHVNQIQSLNFHLDASQLINKEDLQITLSRRLGGWRWEYPINGITAIQTPTNFVYDNGDLYVAITNFSGTDTIMINNAGFSIVALLEDGSIRSYGIDPAFQN